jgi:uncharacterized protein (DUF779 family)
MTIKKAARRVTVKIQYYIGDDIDRMKWLKDVIIYITTQQEWQIWYDKDDIISAAAARGRSKSNSPKLTRKKSKSRSPSPKAGGRRKTARKHKK